MIIVNRDENLLVNLSCVTRMFIGRDDFTIYVAFSSGDIVSLARYSSFDVACIAMGILCDNVGKADVCAVPDDDYIKSHYLSKKRI